MMSPLDRRRVFADVPAAVLQWFTPVPGLSLELCHDRSLTDMADSGTGSLLCYGFGTGKWQLCTQWYESTPVADIAVNRHQSSISSLES